MSDRGGIEKLSALLACDFGERSVLVPADQTKHPAAPLAEPVKIRPRRQGAGLFDLPRPPLIRAAQQAAGNAEDPFARAYKIKSLSSLGGGLRDNLNFI